LHSVYILWSNIISDLTELTHDEMRTINGGIFDNVWEAIGYLMTFEARKAMYNDNAPAVFAFK